VLLVALLVIMLMSTWVLAHESRRLHIEQLQDLAVPLLVETNYANRTQGSKYGLLPMPIEEALRQQAVSMGIRVLLIDPDGSVQLDTEVERSLKGQRISAFVEPLADLQADAEPEDGIVRSEAVPKQGEPNPLAGYRVVMAVDARPPDSALFVAAPPTRPEAVERLSTRYGIALATAIGVAALAGLMMSKAVSAPVSALAAAADAMARGDFAQHVPGEGPDEIGLLIARFNAMSRTVAAVDRSQRALLADVAHELRTPLTSVRGYAQALRSGVAADPQSRERALVTIEAESERMGRLVDELLDLSRLESGQSRLRFEALGVDDVFARTVARFSPSARAREVELAYRSAPGLAVQADDDRLAQALGNLVDNALRHTGSGGSVSLSAEGADGMVRLAVADTGTGMDRQTAERAFDRFQRGPDEDDAGFGLGLSIVREIVFTHRGTVGIDSEIGSGTTVTLALPAAVDSR
jgi:signal transduction histidine kinase